VAHLALNMRYHRSLAISRRHKRLLGLIRSGTFSCPTLAVKLAVSEQTVYRDIEFLKQNGHDIRSLRHADGWAYELLSDSAANSSGRRR